MSKPITNNRINYNNSYGRIIQHDLFLDQGVRQGDSPTFASLQLTGDAVIEGNLLVQGNTTIFDTNVIETEDNIILVNRLETGSGVTLSQAGLEVERGTLENFRMVYDENGKVFKTGPVSDLRPVPNIESNPLDKGVFVWNNATSRQEAQDHVDIDFTFRSTTNASGSLTGALVVNGGLNVNKNIRLNQNIELNSTGSLQVSSGNVVLNAENTLDIIPGQNIRLPFNKPIVFGSTVNSLSVNTSGTASLAFSRVNLTTNRIDIPQQSTLNFSTTSESIYTDSINNLNVTSSQDINLTPASNKKVQLPNNTPLALGNDGRISSNVIGDLSIAAGNNIFLTPGTGLNVRLPVNSGVRFGNGGDQRIFSDTLNILNINSASDVKITQPTVSNLIVHGIQTDRLSSLNDISIESATTFQKNVQYNSTVNATNSSDGSVNLQGGIGIQKDIHIGQNLYTPNFTTGNTVEIRAGHGYSTSASLKLNNNSGSQALSLIALETNFDTVANYLIGRKDPRILNVNLPSYTEYNNTGPLPKFSISSEDGQKELFSIESDTGNITVTGSFGTSNTQNAVSPTEASFIVYGGLGVVRDIVTSGDIKNAVNSTSAILVSNELGQENFRIDTLNDKTVLNSNFVQETIGSTLLESNSQQFNVYNQLNINNTEDTTSFTNASLVVRGGVSIFKGLHVWSPSIFESGVDMSNSKITNLGTPVNPKDAATKEYVDLAKNGLNVKDAVDVASTSPLTISTDTVIGFIIDGYTLQSGDRILLKDQTDPIENGIYEVQASGPAIRSIDLLSGVSTEGVFVFVINGTMNGNLGWFCNTAGPNDIVGTDSLHFTQFTGLGQVDPGAALSKNFNQLNVNVDDYSIEVFSDALRIKSDTLSTGLTGGSGQPITTTTDQSHVTKLGTINTGVWQGSVVGVPYGGTGQVRFTSGSILFGNGVNGLSTNNRLHYNAANTFFGIGTNLPQNDIHIKNTRSTSIRVETDADNNNPTAEPSIQLTYGTKNGSIKMTRSDNSIKNTYADSMTIDTQNDLHLLTGGESRITIMETGEVGIATSNPGYTLDIQGTLHSDDSVLFNKGENSINPMNGGTLTIQGGASVSQDLHIGGMLYAGSSVIGGAGGANSFEYLTVTAFEDATNLTSGGLVTYGGITIQTSTEAVSPTNGGALLVNGGAAVNRNLIVGETVDIKSNGDNFIGNFLLTTDAGNNYIQSGNNTRDFGSFDPIKFSNLGATNVVSSIHQDGITVNNEKYIQIGGTLEVQDGYRINYSSGTLSVAPFNSTYNINIPKSNLKLNGNSQNFVEWNGTTEILNLQNLELQLGNGNDILSIFTPTTSGNVSIQADSNLTLNIGDGGLGEIDLVLSNASGSQSVKYEPSSSTKSNLTIENGIYTTFNDHVEFTDKLYHQGGGLFTNIMNTSGSAKWYYLGQLTGHTQIEWTSDVETIATISVNNTTLSASHVHNGDLLFNDPGRSHFNIFFDGNSYQLFINIVSTGDGNLIVKHSDALIIVEDEGTGLVPNGSASSFNNWTLSYTTQKESNYVMTLGHLTIEGQLSIADNLVKLGHNNWNNPFTRDVGFIIERYQMTNDTGTGDIVSDPFAFIDTLPNQSTANSTQIKFSSNTSDEDEFYTGYWIKIATGTNINQVRQIIAYNGAQRVATISDPWTGQNPSVGDTVLFYNDTYSAFYFDESNKLFALSYTNKTDIFVDRNRYAGIKLDNIILANTTSSLNSTTGSIVTWGGISISDTHNALSSTQGGTLTSLGGAAFDKTLLVGQNIGIGTGVLIPDTSIHVKQDISAITLEGLFDSSVHFTHQTSPINYSIALLEDQLRVAGNTFVISSNGNIGINTTTNIISPIGLSAGHFISTDSDESYLGLISSNSDSDSLYSRIKLYGNNATGSSGNVDVHTGSNGNLKIFNGDSRITAEFDNESVSHFYNTIPSKSSTSGSILVSGGVAISCTENSENFVNGGALTVAGGMSVNKDIYIGGNLFITGNLNAAGSVTSPVVTFLGEVNCNVLDYGNAKLIDLSNEAIFSFYVEVIPTVSSEYCQFQFVPPGRTNAFIERGEAIITSSGWTDDTEVIPLFNLIAVGEKGSNSVLVKFQSVNTSTHYIQFTCRYLIA